MLHVLLTTLPGDNDAGDAEVLAATTLCRTMSSELGFVVCDSLWNRELFSCKLSDGLSVRS